MLGFLLASVLVAFVAGVIAFAMPCCFSVLLPSYFASAFQRRVKVLSMTAVFAAGIAVVLLPVTLAANAFGQWISARHSLFFVAGGFFMILVGMLALWGKSIIPQIRLPVTLQRTGTANVFALGVFSGVATSCCAPVLAGIVVLSALSSSVVSSLLVGLAYVAGMIVPLVLAAVAWDRKSSGPGILQGRVVRLRAAGLTTEIHSSNLIAGALFVSMGVVTIALGLTNTMVALPGSDVVGLFQVQLEQAITQGLNNAVGTAIAIVLIFGALGVLLLLGLRARPRSRSAPQESSASAEERDEPEPEAQRVSNPARSDEPHG